MEPTENANATNKSRYWLAYFLDDMPVGTVFEPGRLHISILPWFVIDTDEREMLKNFYEFFENNLSFEVRLGERVMFGPQKDVAVNMLEESPEIYQLHQKALEWFAEAGARWAVKNPFVGQEFVPHVRRRRGSRLQAGRTLKISSLTLVKAARREDERREVAARIEFNDAS